MIRYVREAIMHYVNYPNEYNLAHMLGVIKDTEADVQVYMQGEVPYLYIGIGFHFYTISLSMDAYEILKEALYVRSE